MSLHALGRPFLPVHRASRAMATHAVAAARSNGAVSAVKAPVPGRLFTFGICSDIQYADLPEGKSHGGTARYYRDSLNGLHRAVAGWQDRGVDFAMHLGDILDGKNPPDRREKALTDVLDSLHALGKRTYHMLGNHCLYNFPRPQLNKRLGIPAQADGSSYYSFSPHPAWRFIVLDTYDISSLGWPAGHPHHETAEQILEERNINEDKNDPTGQEGPARRFVKFGGGVSNTQLEWLQMELAKANQQGQRVVVFGHQPLHQESCTPVTLCWDYEQILHILQSAGNVVAAFSGHTHQDGFAEDEAGIQYRTFNAILETPPGRDCYGFIDVYEDRLDVIGVDNLASQEIKFASASLKIKCAGARQHTVPAAIN